MNKRNEDNNTMELNDFLTIDKLGNNFLAVKGYSDNKNRDSGELESYSLEISIQDEKSPFYFDLISVKVKNLNPTVSVESLKNAKTTPVKLSNLQMGQFNGRIWINCTDVLPVPTSK